MTRTEYTFKAKLCDGNIKLGNMATFSKLMGDDDYITPVGIVKGSCGKHCAGCKHACYVKKSYRYPSVVLGHARNTLAMRLDIDQAFNDIDKQLSRKRHPFAVVRVHQSGEIESPLELLKWVLLARKHPESVFYTYTKNFNAVYALISSIRNGFEMPDNFIINLSVWHEYGMKEYEDLKEYSFIKAFVYMDGFDYESNGLNIQTTCTAYDNDGKLNHAITCDKCKKCFGKTFKVIGCLDH